MSESAGIADWWKSLCLFCLGCIATGFLFVTRDLVTGAQLDKAIAAEAATRSQADDLQRAEQVRANAKLDRVDGTLTGIDARLETMASLLKAPTPTR